MPIKLWQGDWLGRTPVGDDHQRSREVVRRTVNGIMKGKTRSLKNGRMVHHEGMLEGDAIYLFETSSRIARYREQPDRIYYPDGAKLRRYTPDFELVLATGQNVLVEVKPNYFYQKEEVQHKLGRIAEHLARSGQQFVVLTEDTLRQEPRLDNLRWVYHQLPRVSPTVAAMRNSLERYRSQFPLSFKDATTRFAKNNLHPSSLLVTGMLTCPLDQPINHDTHLHIIEEDGHGWFYIADAYGF